MSSSPDPTADPAVTGVPPETPGAVRPSATGLVTGPLDGETDVEVADIATGNTAGGTDSAALDQTLADAEGGVDGSTLDAPDS